MRTCLLVVVALLLGTACECRGRGKTPDSVVHSEPLTRRQQIPDTKELERRAADVEPCSDTPSTVTGIALDAAIDGHATRRSTSGASNMMEMTYSEELARRAQQQSDSCQWNHLQEYLYDCNGDVRYGQNLYMCGSKIDTSSEDAVTFMLEKAMVAWWENEIDAYDYEENTHHGMTGHYTQMAWATTNLVGCAVQACEEVTVYTDNTKTETAVMWANGGTIVTCTYAPGGNEWVLNEAQTMWVLRRPFLKGDACSACGENEMEPGMGYKCDNGFCANCDLDDDDCDGCPSATCGSDAVSWCKWVSLADCASDDYSGYYRHVCEHRCKCGDDVPDHHAKCPKPTVQKRNLLEKLIKLLEE